jgi:Putative prokaryotic signal transducing protein
MDELVSVAVARFEGEAVALRDLLRSAGIDAIYRATNQGAGAFDGLVTSAPQEILVRAEDAEVARQILEPSE